MGKPSIMFPPTALALLAGLSVSAHHSPGYYFETAVVIVHADATVVSFTPANPHGRLVYSMRMTRASTKNGLRNFRPTI